MNGWYELAVFAGLMALGQFSPGPDMLLLTRTALREGTRNGVWMALGIACGLAFHATLAIAGLAVVLSKAPALRVALHWVAALYLLWLARGLLRDCFVAWNSGVRQESGPGIGISGPFRRGLMCNLLNPKVALFLAAICAPFLAEGRSGFWPLALWVVVVFQSGVLWAAWAVLLQWKPLRSRYERSAGWIDGIFGLALVALACRLVFVS